MWSNSCGNVGVFTQESQASRKTQLSVLLPFIVPDRSAIKTNYLIPRRNVPFFRNVYLNWPCFVLRNIQCFKSCLVCFCIQIYIQFTQRQRGKWFKKTTSQVHVLYVLMFCVFPLPPPVYRLLKTTLIIDRWSVPYLKPLWLVTASRRPGVDLSLLVQPGFAGLPGEHVHVESSEHAGGGDLVVLDVAWLHSHWLRAA